MFIIRLAEVLSKHTRPFLGKKNTVWYVTVVIAQIMT